MITYTPESLFATFPLKIAGVVNGNPPHSMAP